jgi:hypothetical protein
MTFTLKLFVVGFEIKGVRFYYCKQKDLGKIIWLFNLGNKYWEMRDYHGTGELNKWKYKNHKSSY